VVPAAGPQVPAVTESWLGAHGGPDIDDPGVCEAESISVGLSEPVEEHPASHAMATIATLGPSLRLRVVIAQGQRVSREPLAALAQRARMSMVG
jgi:hypothetical protein